MDSATQAILGATIGEAGWRRELGPRAVVVGALVGTLPDLDVVALAAGHWSMLLHHRGITHALVFAPVMCLPLGWLARRWAGRGTLAQWTSLVFWALATHPLLDACTTYGTQLLYPFSRHRTAIDAVAILDPIYTGALLVALAVAWLARSRPQVGAWAARVALVATTVWLGFGFAQSHRAEEQLRGALEPAFEPVEVRATPALGTVFGWRVVARDADRDLRIAMASTLHPYPLDVLAMPWPDSELVERALATRHGEITAWFSMDMVGARVFDEGDDTVVRLDDQRYGRYTDPAQALWGARFVFDAAGNLVSSEWVEERYEVRPLDEIRAIIAVVRGPADTPEP